MATFYSVQDTETTELNKGERTDRDTVFFSQDINSTLLEESTETQYVQVVEEKTDYFDGYYEVGVLLALGVIIGISIVDMLVRKWHT